MKKRKSKHNQLIGNAEHSFPCRRCCVLCWSDQWAWTLVMSSCKRWAWRFWFPHHIWQHRYFQDQNARQWNNDMCDALHREQVCSLRTKVRIMGLWKDDSLEPWLLVSPVLLCFFFFPFSFNGHDFIFSFPPTILINSGVTLTWEESISHAGSPFRIAILDEKEVARIVLLDHIPHNDESSPAPYVESTYTPYKISVKIPDVNCEKCSLQLLYVMTDKTVKCGSDLCFYNPLDAACKGSTNPSAATCAGAPNDNVCVQENECFSNCEKPCVLLIHAWLTCIADHSCSDVTIKGSRALEEFEVNNQPSEWPFGTLKMQYYGKEIGQWKNGWLQNIPSNFTVNYDTLTCWMWCPNSPCAIWHRQDLLLLLLSLC